MPISSVKKAAKKTVARKATTVPAAKAAPAKKAAPRKATKATAPAKARGKSAHVFTVTLPLIEPKRVLAQFGDGRGGKAIDSIYPRMSVLAEEWGDELPVSVTVTITPNW